MFIFILALCILAYSSPIFGTPEEIIQGNKIISVINKERAQYNLPKVSYFYEFLWDVNNFESLVGKEYLKNCSKTLLTDPMFESGMFYSEYGMEYLLTGKVPFSRKLRLKSGDKFLTPNLERVASFAIDENYFMYGRITHRGR